MPVPLSSAIFAVVAAIPFGLAIKDTVTGKYDADAAFQARNNDDDDDADTLEQYGDEQAARQQILDDYRATHRVSEQALREIELAQQQARRVPRSTFDGLAGAEVATIGTRFDNLRLGGPKSATDLSQLFPGHDVALLDDGSTTHTLYIRVDSDPDPCDVLAEVLDDAWGRQFVEDYEQIWTNQAIGQRAILSFRSSCELTFEQITPIDTWLAKSTTASVPIGLIGRPAKQLRDTLGTRANVSQDDGSITWTAPSVGTGAGRTSVTAFTKAGRVVGLLASARLDDATQDLVVKRITTLVGKEPIEPEPDTDAPMTWKTTPKVTLETGSQISLRIGEQGR